MSQRTQQAPAIAVRNLRKHFRGSRAVNDVTFSVERGEVFGILGPNGAGKTTTVECIAGALKPDDGDITVLGVHPSQDRQVVRERVGYQMQTSTLPASLRVKEALDLYASFYASPAPVADLLDAVGLAPHRNRPFGKLSGGQKQRLSIALALIGTPDVVVLDELTTGVDPEGRREVWRLVEGFKDQGITCILVSHDLDEIDRLCDRFAIIVDGRTRFVGASDELVVRYASPSRARWTLEDSYVAFLDDARQKEGTIR